MFDLYTVHNQSQLAKWLGEFATCGDAIIAAQSLVKMKGIIRCEVWGNWENGETYLIETIKA